MGIILSHKIENPVLIDKYLMGIELEAVSYTHLDVYKRQLPVRLRLFRYLAQRGHFGFVRL